MLQGYILILLITFGELAIGFTLLRIDYSVLIAVAVALLDILPVVGTGTVLIPWSLISLLIGKIPQGIGLLVLYITITVVRNIIEPRIIGARIGLHPLATLIFMYLGLHLFGVIGMLLLPLIIILLKNAQDAGVLKIWK
jgi:predicted PurR-regulated permease PerM